MSPPPQDGQSARVRSLARGLWRALASVELLVGIGGVLIVTAVLIAAVPALRPGFGLGDGIGASRAAWDAFHPVAAWALRGLLAAASLASLVRLADTLWPTLVTGHRVTHAFQVQGDADSGDRIWAHLVGGLARNGWVLASHSGGQDERYALALQPFRRRVWAASLYLGLILLIMSLSAMWRYGAAASSPYLVLGQTTWVATPVAKQVELVELDLLFEPQQELGILAARVTLTEAEGTTRQLRVRPNRLAQTRGWWVSIASHAPAARIVVLDRHGAGLEVYPMVGSQPADLVQRVALVGHEEQLLAAPEANLLIRVLGVGAGEGLCCIHVQALDGRQGALLAEAFVYQPTDLSVGEVTLRVTPERAVALRFYRAPGLGLAALAAALILCGAIGHVVAPPRRAEISLAYSADLGGWVVVLAASSRPKRSHWFVALSDAVRAELESSAS